MASVTNLKDLCASRNIPKSHSQLQFRMTYGTGRAVLNVVRKSIDECHVRSIRLAYPVSLAVNALFN